MHSRLLPKKNLRRKKKTFIFLFLIHFIMVQIPPIPLIILSKTWTTNAYFVINVQIDMSFARQEPYSSIVVFFFNGKFKIKIFYSLL